MSGIPCEQIATHGSSVLPYETPLYRYLSGSTYRLLLENQELWLRKITSWHDSHEGMRFDAMKCKEPSHPYAGKMLDDFYATCWSLQTEDKLLFVTERDSQKSFDEEAYQRSVVELATHGSDAMWRAYCPRGGVRIKTTIGKLVELLSSASLPTTRLHAGQVYYDPFESNWGGTLGSKHFASAFLQKRVCFRSEAEFRFLFCASEDVADTSVKIPIQNLYHFIDEVLVSPAKLSDEAEIHELVNISRRIAPGNVKDGKQFCRISQLNGNVGFPRN